MHELVAFGSVGAADDAGGLQPRDSDHSSRTSRALTSGTPV